MYEKPLTLKYKTFHLHRSAFCSLSVIGRTTMVTPTPRTISPQDIVRIYVPPAPPDEKHQQKHHEDNTKKLNMSSPSTKDSKPNSITVSEVNNIQKHSNNNNHKIISNNGNVSPDKTPSPPSTQMPPKTLSGLTQTHESNKNSIIYGSGDLTPVHCVFNQSDDDLAKNFADASLSTNNSLGYIGGSSGGGVGATTSSSSRRGSLSRKSPSAMFESNMLMECSHMIKRRLSTQSNSSSINIEMKDKQISLNEVTSSNLGNSSLSLRLNSNGETKKRMTSFEELAASRYKSGSISDDKLNNDEHDKYSPDDDENYSYSYYKYKSAESRQRKSPITVESSKRFVSESNVLSMRRSSKECEYQALNKRRPNSSGNETSLFQYETFTVTGNGGNISSTVHPSSSSSSSHKTTSIKEYKRFYGTSNEYDTCDEELKKSSDESSSPKSVLNSPDKIPLLQSSPPSNIPKLKSPVSPTHHIYSIVASQPESPVTMKPSRIPIMHSPQERKISTNSSPTIHISPNSSELNRVLPPIEVVSSSSSSKKLIKTPTSPNGQPISYVATSATPNRPTKLYTKNGATINDSNTIRIKVNQNDKQ